MALVVVKAQPPVAELLTKHTVLFREVVDDFFLLAVQVAASEGDQ
jgi:hypothetical protein